MYQIKIAKTDREFEEMARSDKRYRNVDDDNLGFADPLKGIAYVRKTSVPALNRYLLSHEFEHLFEEKGTHEDEFGIRHKKFFKEVFVPYIAPIIIGALGGGVAGAGSAHAGLGALLGGLMGGGEAAVQGVSQSEAAKEQKSMAKEQQQAQESFFNQFQPSQTFASPLKGSERTPEISMAGPVPEVNFSGDLTRSLNKNVGLNIPSQIANDFRERQSGFFRPFSPISF